MKSLGVNGKWKCKVVMESNEEMNDVHTPKNKHVSNCSIEITDGHLIL
jgi:hypothetical protein